MFEMDYVDDGCCVRGAARRCESCKKFQERMVRNEEWEYMSLTKVKDMH